MDIRDKVSSLYPTIIILIIIRVRLLQSDIFYAEGRNDLAVNILIDCITHCHKHHLHSLSVCAQLKLVRSQVCHQAIIIE